MVGLRPIQCLVVCPDYYPDLDSISSDCVYNYIEKGLHISRNGKLRKQTGWFL